MVAAALLVASVAAAGGPPRGPLKACPPDAVTAGTACVDKYEASVWRVPNAETTNHALVTRIRQGRATVALLEAGGATRLGIGTDDYAPCADDGQGCDGDVYAASVAAVPPSASITWFQAQEACANSGKRLPTNAEWQVASNGTPDAPDDHATTCTVSSAAISLTGARSACVSARGAFDMAGNVVEWVADWVPLSTACPGWGEFSDDLMCLAGAATTGSGPGALLRGGSLFGGGPLAVLGTATPSRAESFVGFRCAR